MKQKNIVVAYKRLVEMYKTKGVPFGISSALFNVKRKLEPYVELQEEKERSIIEQNNSGVNDEGNYVLSKDNVAEINKQFAEIQNADVDYEGKPVVIELSQDLCDKLGITGEDIETLEGFIQFEETSV